MVVIKPYQEANTPMETETTIKASKGAEAGLNQLPVIGVRFIDGTDKKMSSQVFDNQQLHSRGAKDRLHKDDMHKYEGDEIFNPKSYQSLLWGEVQSHQTLLFGRELQLILELWVYYLFHDIF